MLFRLPLELSDLIIEKVDTPRDLAALSAVCKTLKKWISPAPAEELGPLQCCYLSLTVDNEEAFRVLIARPRLARCVKRLRLLGALDERPPGYQRRPDGFWTAHTEAISSFNPALVNAALRAMENLQFLTTRSVLIEPNESLFWGMKKCCPFLSDISLSLKFESSRTFDIDGQLEEEECFTKSLTGLEGSTCYRLSFAFCSTVPPNVLDSFARSMRNLLYISHTQVRYLSIKQAPTSLDRIFGILFPSLEYFELLTLSYLGFINSTELTSFLDNHPTLRHVVLHAELAALPDGALPNLRRIYCTSGSQITTLLKPLADGTYRPLEWLYVDHALVADGRSALLANFQSLTTLDVYEPESQITLFEMPMLPCVSTLSWCPNVLINSDPLQETERVIAFLSQHFPSLRCLKRFLNYMTMWPWPLETVLRKLEEACPDLEIIDEWVRIEPGVWHNDPRMSPNLEWLFELDTDKPIHCLEKVEPVVHLNGHCQKFLF